MALQGVPSRPADLPIQAEAAEDQDDIQPDEHLEVPFEDPFQPNVHDPLDAPIPRLLNVFPQEMETRVRSLRGSTLATRAARGTLPESIVLSVFASTHHALLQRDKEFVLNLSIADACLEFGPKAVEDAILSEIHSLIADTQAIEPCKSSTQQLPLHLILTHKYDAHGNYVKTKARIVIGGNLQHRDENMNTSSFCVRTQTILMSLGIAQHKKMGIYAVDIKTAYLHANVNSHVLGRMSKKLVPYLLKSHPHMKDHLNRDGSMTFKVKKALYGLAEASRLWFLHLTGLLTKIGYVASDCDKGALYRHTPDGLVVILLHVDDMLVLTCNAKYWIELKDYFNSNLRGITAQEGPAISFVGLNIQHHKDHISVNRRGYIEKLASKRDSKDVPSSDALYPLHLNAIQQCANSPALPEHALTSAIMELRYVDDVRPDIKFATAFLTQQMSKPTIALRKCVNHLLHYLHCTKDLSIRIAPSNLNLNVYVDAAYALLSESRSQYGIAVCMGDQGYAFHTKSSAIKVVCRSSTEAELHAANEVCSDVLHALDLLAELRVPQGTVPFFEDNQAVIHMMIRQETNYQTKSKHIRVRYDFLKQQVAEKKIEFVYIPTDLQLADVLTKPLIGDKFAYFRDCLMGIVPHQPYAQAHATSTARGVLGISD